MDAREPDLTRLDAINIVAWFSGALSATLGPAPAVVLGIMAAGIGVLTAITGTLIASQIGFGTGTTATGMELDVIAAAIIGGTSLFGGKGRIWSTLVGVLFLGCITNGMTLLNVSEYWQYVVRGAIILGAVLLNQVLEEAGS
jgi:ribose/xylose/arabinose/galactoside ABC-type transport system permease subunit